MPSLTKNLELERCPHCNVYKPLLQAKSSCETSNHRSKNKMFWYFYVCSHCGGVVSACAKGPNQVVEKLFPSSVLVPDVIPSIPREYLQQAINSLHSPAGSVMLSASSIDAMLKDKGYKKGSLYSRIDKAAESHLITSEMAEWAHQVRLDANEQRHADDSLPLPTEEDAQRVIDFSLAFAQYLFVLPSMVIKGINPPK